MRLIKNVGADRVLEHLQRGLTAKTRLDAASDGLSMFAFESLQRHFEAAGRTRLLLSHTKRPIAKRELAEEMSSHVDFDPRASGLLGDESDRERRNTLGAKAAGKARQRQKKDT